MESKRFLTKSTFLSLMIALMVSFISCDEDDSITDITEGNSDVILPEISGYPVVGTKQTTYYNNSIKYFIS